MQSRGIAKRYLRAKTPPLKIILSLSVVVYRTCESWCTSDRGFLLVFFSLLGWTLLFVSSSVVASVNWTTWAYHCTRFIRPPLPPPTAPPQPVQTKLVHGAYLYPSLLKSINDDAQLLLPQLLPELLELWCRRWGGGAAQKKLLNYVRSWWIRFCEATSRLLVTIKLSQECIVARWLLLRGFSCLDRQADLIRRSMQLVLYIGSSAPGNDISRRRETICELCFGGVFCVFFFFRGYLHGKKRRVRRRFIRCII